MRLVLQLFGLSGFLASALVSTHALAQEPDADGEPDAQHTTEEPKAAEKPAAVLPAAPLPAPAEVPKAKFGDTTTSGYFRGGFGGSNQMGRMTCFQLALQGGLLSKYRLGNECEVWAEFHLTTVVYAGADGSVAHVHFMPAAFIPTTYIGHPPTGVTSSDLGSPGTGATVAFPNLYVDMGLPWLANGTAWAGTRYYKRESVYISDFFYWNPSGVGAGVEDINLNKDLRLSVAAFAVDGQPVGTPQLPRRADFGIRGDVQLRGIKFYEGGELQVGLQGIADLSSKTDDATGLPRTMDNSSQTHGGWGVTLQYVQELLGGNNKLAFQYGRGGGTGFGTLARFYAPDFSLYNDPAESRMRFVDVLTVQPTEWLGAQAALVYQHDDLGYTGGKTGGKTDWISAGTRVGVAPLEHFKVLGEVGFDRVKKDNGAIPQWLAKFTIAPTLTAGKGFMTRPELRLFYTYAMWDESARGATVDSGKLYTIGNKLSGATFGLQGETWW